MANAADVVHKSHLVGREDSGDLWVLVFYVTQPKTERDSS